MPMNTYKTIILSLSVIVLSVTPASAAPNPNRPANTIKLRYQQFDPLDRVPDVAQSLKANASSRLHIVQFNDKP